MARKRVAALLLAVAVSGCRGEALTDGSDAGASGPTLGHGTGDVGSLCQRDDDCSNLQCALSEDYFPAGYCTLLHCDAIGIACPAGSDCEPAGDGNLYCLKRCDPAAPLWRTGYSCCPGGSQPSWYAPIRDPLCHE